MRHLEIKTTYPNKFDTKQYVEKRVANDILMYVYGRDFSDNEETTTINNLWTAEDVVIRAMDADNYFNVVTRRMEPVDAKFKGLDWWQVLDEDTLDTMCDDAMFTSYDNYIELYNLTELAG